MLGLLVMLGILVPLGVAARYLMTSTQSVGPNSVSPMTMELFIRCVMAMYTRINCLVLMLNAACMPARATFRPCFMQLLSLTALCVQLQVCGQGVAEPSAH